MYVVVRLSVLWMECSASCAWGVRGVRVEEGEKCRREGWGRIAGVRGANCRVGAG